MIVNANLPEEIYSITYVKNSHFIEIGDKNKKMIKLLPKAMVLYRCNKCEFEMYTASSYGTLLCPICRDEMEHHWGQEQTCFVPEKDYGKTEFYVKDDKKEKK